MSTYHTWYLSLAGMLVMAAPLSAQEPAQKMIIAVWPDTSAASSTVQHMTKTAKGQIAAYGVLVKHQDGSVEVRERYHNPTGPGAGVQASDSTKSTSAVFPVRVVISWMGLAVRS